MIFLTIGFDLKAQDCVIVTNHRKPRFEPEFLHKFRGALGRVLGASASSNALRGNPCSFDPPSAYDVMHNNQGNFEGRPLPKPYVLRLDPRPHGMQVTMRLFGRACDWRQVMLHSMIAAARRGLGDAQDVEVTDAFMKSAPLPQRLPSSRIEAVFESPLILRTKELSSLNSKQSVDPRLVVKPLLDGIGLRLSGIALWHDVKSEQFNLCADGLAIEQSALEAIAINRGPGRPRIGVNGRLSLVGCDARLRQYLAIAAITHVGADTTIGAGRICIG